MTIVINLLFLISPEYLDAQMVSVVNSLADDEFAHPHDKGATHNIDESTDGICGDSLGRCTLRAALEEASYIGQPAHVTFSGSLSGNLVVDDMMGPLYPPDVSFIQGARQKVIIYGNSFASSVLLILGNLTTITGLGFANGLIGIVVEGDNNLIGANLDPVNSNYFHHFSQNGILVAGNKNSIQGNRIGIAYDNTPIGSKYGIFITGESNVIGGTSQGNGNIISGNDIGIGVYTIEDSTFIYGNKIGTDSAGTHAVANRVGIDNIGPNVYIGNNTAGGINVIAGNTESGVLFGLDAGNCKIAGNKIGTDLSGTLSIPNRDGITLGPGTENCTVEHNEIKFNTYNGILLSGIDLAPELLTQHNVISGNTIQQNVIAGIAITGDSKDNVIGSSLTAANDSNDISFNGHVGVTIVPGTGIPEGNTIRKNSFRQNSTLGIQLVAAGSQDNMVPPDSLVYRDDGLGYAILSGKSVDGATIDVYKAEKNNSGKYEGREWFAQGVSQFAGVFVFATSLCDCDTIVVTATNPNGSTSEFSAPVGVLIVSTHDQLPYATLVKAYPNPFDENTTIEFELTKAENVALTIYDMAGRKMETLLEGRLQQGKHKKLWNANANPAGIYYYQLKTGNFIIARKLVYLK